MESNLKNELYIYTVICLLFCCSIFINEFNNIVASLIMLIIALASFFIIAKIKGNFMSMNAIYTAVWIGTIGLSNMKLLEYQIEWSLMTWIYLIIALYIFNITILLGNIITKHYLNTHRIYKITNIVNDTRSFNYFMLCVIVTVISILCLYLTYRKVGFFPFFNSNDSMAYSKFYSKFHLITLASTSISGLAYYTIKKCEIGNIKKLILYFCILYLVFLMPIITVSRGIFMCASISLSTAVFYLNDKKLIVLIICMVLSFGGYELGSYGRHYTEEALESFFQPKVINKEKKESNKEQDSSNNNVNNNGASIEKKSDIHDEYINSEKVDKLEETTKLSKVGKLSETDKNEGFKLNPKIAFLYSYLSVSHDNFNLAVNNANQYTYGIRQLQPIDFLLRRFLGDYNANFEYYKIKPSLTTTNFIGSSFYDLRIVGVIIFLLFWGVIFGSIEAMYIKYKSPFLMLLHSNNMYCILLSFFSAFVNQVSYLLFLSMIAFIFGVVYIQIKLKGRELK